MGVDVVLRTFGIRPKDADVDAVVQDRTTISAAISPVLAPESDAVRPRRRRRPRPTALAATHRGCGSRRRSCCYRREPCESPLLASRQSSRLRKRIIASVIEITKRMPSFCNGNSRSASSAPLSRMPRTRTPSTVCPPAPNVRNAQSPFSYRPPRMNPWGSTLVYVMNFLRVPFRSHNRKLLSRS